MTTQRQQVRDMFTHTTRGIRRIALSFGISPTTVYQYIKDLL